MVKHKRIILFLLGIVFLISFALFTIVVKKNSLKYFDFDTTVRIQDHIPKNFDTFLSFYSIVGSFEVMSVFIAIFLLKQKKIGVIPVVVLYLIAHLIEYSGKSILHHPGPPFMFFRYDLAFLFPSSYVQTDSSYPSGHTFRTIFLSVLLADSFLSIKKFQLSNRMIMIGGLIVFDLFMIVSRVSLGEHWATDVVGGALLALGLGPLALLFL